MANKLLQFLTASVTVSLCLCPFPHVYPPPFLSLFQDPWMANKLLQFLTAFPSSVPPPLSPSLPPSRILDGQQAPPVPGSQG